MPRPMLLSCVLASLVVRFVAGFVPLETQSIRWSRLRKLCALIEHAAMRHCSRCLTLCGVVKVLDISKSRQYFLFIAGSL